MRFRGIGYRTGAVTGGLFVSKTFGADRGFETFEEGGTELAIEWLQAHREQPFFLLFHTYYPHAAYKDRRYLDDLDGGRLQRIYEKNLASFELHTRVCCEGFEPMPEEREFLLAFYDGGIAGADEMVARLVGALDRFGVLDRTTIIITSDHGEEFWQHTGRAAYHGHSLYDEMLRVPLIWYERGLSRAGTSSAQPVSLIDIVPTVVSRFGLEPDEALEGVDLSPILDGGRWEVERPLFGEAVRHGPTRSSIRTAAGKLIVSGGPQRGEGIKFPVPVLAPEELYLAGDRDEKHNRRHTQQQLARELGTALSARQLAVRPPEPKVEQPRIDVETRERLRALGYFEP
jgi:arylsulfatase A-like enzyme